MDEQLAAIRTKRNCNIRVRSNRRDTVDALNDDIAGDGPSLLQRKSIFEQPAHFAHIGNHGRREVRLKFP